MIATDTNIKRMLQQLEDAAVDVFTKPAPKPYAFGLAISFITTTLLITKQLAEERRLTLKLEGVQRKTVSDAVKSGGLTINQSDLAGKDANQDDAHYRHLRNCFAHGNWRYSEAAVTPANLSLTLEDYSMKKGKAVRTFAATIGLPALIDLAERLLVETFNNMP